VLEGGEAQQLRDGGAEVGVRQLDQLRVAELEVLSQVGQGVLVPPGPLHLAGVRQEHSRRAELVECDVRQRDVLLHLRRSGRPLAEPLRRDERVVAEPEQVGEQLTAG
jgi:hypothetical protein